MCVCVCVLLSARLPSGLAAAYMFKSNVCVSVCVCVLLSARLPSGLAAAYMFKSNVCVSVCVCAAVREVALWVSCCVHV